MLPVSSSRRGDRPLDPAPEAVSTRTVPTRRLGRDDRPVALPRRDRRACASRAGRRSAAAGGTAGRGRRTSRAGYRPAAAARAAVRPDWARGVDSSSTGSVGGRRQPAIVVGLATATRPRSGTGSTAGRRGGPRPRCPAAAAPDPAGHRLGLGEVRAVAVEQRQRARSPGSSAANGRQHRLVAVVAIDGDQARRRGRARSSGRA